VSGNYFSVLGLTPAAGRLFVDADDDRARGTGVVISHRYWERHFGRDPNVAGASVSVNETSCAVLGVAPVGFDGTAAGNPTDVWIPLSFRPSVAPAAPPDLTLIGRLKPAITRADAQTRVRALVPSLQIGDAFEIQDNKPDWFDLIVTDGSTGASDLRAKHASALTIGMAAAIIDLLIACANLAGLVLARATARQREVALLVSLGAGRWRIVRQMFLQNLVLAGAGGLVGWWLAGWGSQVLVGLVSGSSDALPGV